ncbi:hypothetical protein [Bauldia sp.]|uniref:hypothetical protein n=1 Tax=Bauldia sp. TaxID=2575872 RepID=UPI003BAC9DC8
MPKNGAAAGVLVMAIVLGGCTTYGTGVTPGKQTVKDITGLVSLGASNRSDPIEYSPRPGIVAPPSADTLPKPGETATAANWPNDPDEAEKQRLANRPAKSAETQEDVLRDPGFRLPSKPVTVRRSSKDPNSAEEQWRQMQGAKDEAEKLFARAKSGRAGAVDAEGNPVRTRLDEPPANYRVPDPTAPEEFAAAEDEKWWQFFRKKKPAQPAEPTPEAGETAEAEDPEAAAPADS